MYRLVYNMVVANFNHGHLSTQQFWFRLGCPGFVDHDFFTILVIFSRQNRKFDWIIRIARDHRIL